MLISFIDEATKSHDASLTAEKALYAMAEFAANMEEHDINPYLISGMEVILKYLNGPGQKSGVRFNALNCMSAYILASGHLIVPHMVPLLEILYQIVKTATDKDS
jgi:hypothetical protein